MILTLHDAKIDAFGPLPDNEAGIRTEMDEITELHREYQAASNIIGNALSAISMRRNRLELELIHAKQRVMPCRM